MKKVAFRGDRTKSFCSVASQKRRMAKNSGGKNKKKTGFAALSKEERIRVGRKGGKAAAAKARAKSRLYR
jgi:hypothetical protein